MLRLGSISSETPTSKPGRASQQQRGGTYTSVHRHAKQQPFECRWTVPRLIPGSSERRVTLDPAIGLDKSRSL
jgi:hypothetical protein